MRNKRDRDAKGLKENGRIWRRQRERSKVKERNKTIETQRDTETQTIEI